MAFTRRNVSQALGFFGVLATIIFLYRTHLQHKLQDLLGRPYVLGNYHWKLGEESLYELEMTQKGHFRLQFFNAADKVASKLPEMPLDIILKGKLKWLPVEKREGHTIIAFTIIPDEFKFHFGQAQPALEKALAQELQRQHAIAVKDDGTLQGFMFADEIQPVTRNILRQLMVAFVPKLTMGIQEEEVLNGWQKSQYRGNCSSSHCSIEKTILGLRSRTDGPEESQMRGQLEFKISAAFDAIEKAKGSREYTLFKAGQKVQSEILTVSLQRLGRKFIDALDMARLSQSLNGRFTSVAGTEEFAEVDRLSMQKLIAGKDFAEEVLKLRSFTAAATINDMMELYKMLLAFITIHPEKIPELAQWLDEFPSTDNRFDLIGVVLARHGSIASQNELMSAIDEKWTDAVAVRQLSMSLALMEKPADTIVEKMIQRFDASGKDEGSRSNFLANIAGAGYNSENQSIKDEIRDRIYQEIQDAQSPQEKQAAFMILGNLGHKDTPSFIKTYIESPKVEDRMMAVEAIRRVKNENADKADQILVAVSENDPAKEVRRASSSWLIGRDLDSESIRSLEASLYNEKDIHVVQNIVDMLARHPTQRQIARSILEEYLIDCGNPQICKKVEQALMGQ